MYNQPVSVYHRSPYSNEEWLNNNFPDISLNSNGACGDVYYNTGNGWHRYTHYSAIYLIKHIIVLYQVLICILELIMMDIMY